METIVRKEWGSPLGKFQEFIPQEFVAACAVEPVIPTGYDKDHFYIDGLDTANHSHSHPKDGICAASTEHTSRLKTFDELQGSMAGTGLEGFLKNYKNAHIDQAYYDLTASNACNEQSYTNGAFFAPVVIVHGGPTSNQFYFLANGYVTSDDPWAYIPEPVKNQLS